MNEPECDRSAPFITVENVVLYGPSRELCPPIRWQICGDQHWAIVGPNGSGKSALARALSGRTPVAAGQIFYHEYSPNGSRASSRPQERIAYVDFEAQRAFMAPESPFYQARWNSVGSEGMPSVADYLSAVPARGSNPYRTVEAPSDPDEHEADRSEVAALLGIEPLLQRRTVEISSGERRKVLLARALLQKPDLLILDNPFAGLDQGFRARLRGIIQELMHGQMRVMVVLPGWEDIPAGITHVLVMEEGLIVAHGPWKADSGGVERAGQWRAIPNAPNPAPVVLNGRNPRPVILNEAQRSEESQSGETEILRFAQNDDGGGVEMLRFAQDDDGGGVEILRFAQDDKAGEGGAAEAGGGRVLVQMEDVSVSYGGVRVLDGIDWTVREGERWALLGPNGAGKTTLLSLILGDNPQAYANRITLFGRRRGTGESIWEIKQQAGWMAPELHLYYPRGMSCLDVVCSGFFDSVGLYRHCSAEQRRAAVHWMERLGVSGLAGRAFRTVSEGQQRLALVARAVVKEPALLVLDEPCQGLDPVHRDRVLRTVEAIAAELEAGVIYVTHDPLALPRGLTHVLQLEAGRIAGRGTYQNLPVRTEMGWA